MSHGVLLQVSVYNDGSNDETKNILENYRPLFTAHSVDYIVTHCSDSNGIRVLNDILSCWLLHL